MTEALAVLHDQVDQLLSDRGRRRWLSVPQAAEYSGLSPESIRRPPTAGRPKAGHVPPDAPSRAGGPSGAGRVHRVDEPIDAKPPAVTGGVPCSRTDGRRRRGHMDDSTATAEQRKSATSGTSPTKKSRRKKAEMQVIRDGLCRLAAEYGPCSVRRTFYQAVVAGLVAKSQNEYKSTVQPLLGELRESGPFPSIGSSMRRSG